MRLQPVLSVLSSGAKGTAFLIAGGTLVLATFILLTFYEAYDTYVDERERKRASSSAG